MLNNLRLQFVTAFLLSCLPAIVFAQGPGTGDGGGIIPCASSNEPCKLSDVYPTIVAIINFLFEKVLIPLAIIALAYGGIKFIVSAGNPGEVGKAKDIIYNAIIGMIIVFGAYLMVRVIVEGLTGGEPIQQVEQYLKK